MARVARRGGRLSVFDYDQETQIVDGLYTEITRTITVIMPISGLCRADVRSQGQVCKFGATCRHNQSASRKASSLSPGR